jgi:hypothetical protein
LPQAEISRESERMLLPTPRPRVGIEAMAGRWLKTNETAQWIGRVDLAADGDQLLVRVFGGGAEPSPADWGIVRSEIVYAGSMTGGDARAGGFVARYELPEMSIELQANHNLGLLVVATYITFRHPGSLADRFTREFFRREEEGELA